VDGQKETRFLTLTAIAGISHEKETGFLWWICRGGFKTRPYCEWSKRNPVSHRRFALDPPSFGGIYTGILPELSMLGFHDNYQSYF
jgi:hypothetical protein